MQRKDFKEMKKTSHKNQIIITALAVMIVVAGYLNFTGQEISTSGLTKSNKETAADKSTENPDSVSSEDAKDISAEEMMIMWLPTVAR